jgi:hypothetical protein
MRGLRLLGIRQAVSRVRPGGPLPNQVRALLLRFGESCLLSAFPSLPGSEVAFFIGVSVSKTIWSENGLGIGNSAAFLGASCVL